MGLIHMKWEYGMVLIALMGFLGSGYWDGFAVLLSLPAYEAMF